jgi:hypothetical protein
MAQDPKTWQAAFKANPAPLEADGNITDEALREEICKYGDLCSITYNNFIKDAKALESFSGAAPNAAAHKKVGDYRFEPSELMRIPAGPGAAQVRPLFM